MQFSSLIFGSFFYLDTFFLLVFMDSINTAWVITCMLLLNSWVKLKFIDFLACTSVLMTLYNQEIWKCTSRGAFSVNHYQLEEVIENQF